MTLKQGDTHKGWTVTETRESGLVVLHQPCESCGCPSKTPEQVRETMIKARTADILNYEHIIADYESKARGS